jgi:hypothetical protein
LSRLGIGLWIGRSRVARRRVGPCRFGIGAAVRCAAAETRSTGIWSFCLALRGCALGALLGERTGVGHRAKSACHRWRCACPLRQRASAREHARPVRPRLRPRSGATRSRMYPLRAGAGWARVQYRRLHTRAGGSLVEQSSSAR